MCDIAIHIVGGRGGGLPAGVCARIMRASVRVCAPERACVCASVCASVCGCRHERACVCAQACAPVCERVRVYVCECVRASACVCVCNARASACVCFLWWLTIFNEKKINIIFILSHTPRKR